MSSTKKARQSARPATIAAEPTHAPATPIRLEPASLAAAQSPPPSSSSAQKRGGGGAKRKAAHAAGDATADNATALISAALPVAASATAAKPSIAYVSEAAYAAHAHAHIARALSPHHIPASLAHTGLEAQVRLPCPFIQRGEFRDIYQASTCNFKL